MWSNTVFRVECIYLANKREDFVACAMLLMSSFQVLVVVAQKLAQDFVRDNRMQNFQCFSHISFHLVVFNLREISNLIGKYLSIRYFRTWPPLRTN